MRQGIRSHMHGLMKRSHMCWVWGQGGNRCTLTNVQYWAGQEEEVRQVPVRIFILLMLLSSSQHVFAAVLLSSHYLKRTRGFAAGLLHACSGNQGCGFSSRRKEQLY